MGFVVTQTWVYIPALPLINECDLEEFFLTPKLLTFKMGEDIHSVGYGGD